MDEAAAGDGFFLGAVGEAPADYEVVSAAALALDGGEAYALTGFECDEAGGLLGEGVPLLIAGIAGATG